MLLYIYTCLLQYFPHFDIKMLHILLYLSICLSGSSNILPYRSCCLYGIYLHVFFISVWVAFKIDVLPLVCACVHAWCPVMDWHSIHRLGSGSTTTLRKRLLKVSE